MLFFIIYNYFILVIFFFLFSAFSAVTEAPVKVKLIDFIPIIGLVLFIDRYLEGK